MIAALAARGVPVEAVATAQQLREMRGLVMVAGALVVFMFQAVLNLLAVSAEVQGIITGVLITLAVALAASVTRLVRLALAIAELYLRKRLKDMGQDLGVDPQQAQDLSDD